MMIEEETVFVKQKEIGDLILSNLFSDDTEKYFNCCSFESTRMAFMQGMNYAGLLCSALLKQYPAIIQHENKSEVGE